MSKTRRKGALASSLKVTSGFTRASRMFATVIAAILLPLSARSSSCAKVFSVMSLHTETLTYASTRSLLNWKYEKAVFEQRPGFEVAELLPNVFIFRYPTQLELNKSFLRFQEYYESPEFRGKIFSRKEFEKYYRTTEISKGRFSYYTDWFGNNLPSHIFEPFFSAKFKYITVRERRVLDFLKSKQGRPFFVMATFTEKSDNPGAPELIQIMHHETAHAFYSQLPDYKLRVDQIIEKLPAVALQRLTDFLVRQNYTEGVLRDEQHAYLLSGWDDLVMSGTVQPSPEIRVAIRDLNANFLETFLAKASGDADDPHQLINERR